MYMIYVDRILFPVAPEKIVTETETKNNVYSLVDGTGIAVPGGKKPKRFAFELLLPMREYPFAVYADGFKDGGYFADELQRIADENKPVWLEVYRTFGGINKTYLTSTLVLPEKVSIKEDADEGEDIRCDIVLREYKTVTTKTAREKLTGGYDTRSGEAQVPYTYTVKSGDSLWLIAKKFLDDGTKYEYLARINGIKKPYTIYANQTIKLRE